MQKIKVSASGWLVLTLLALFVIRGLIYATVVPLWNAPDEPGHYQTVEQIAHGVLPGFQPDKLFGGPSSLYSGRPSGYYWVSALMGMAPASRATLVTRAYILRFLSVLLSTAVVYFTYRMAREAFPDDVYICFGAPLIVAMLPMYAFTGMSINPDNLAVPIFTLFLWLAVRTLARGFSPLNLALMVLLVAAGLLTKRTTFVSAGLLASLPLLYVFREPAKTSAQRFSRLLPFGLAVGGLAVGGSLLTAMGLTFAQLDPWIFIRAVGQTGTIVSSGQLVLPAQFLISTFWGNFGWANVPIDQGLYPKLQNVWLLPALGYIFLIVKSRWRETFTRKQSIIMLLLAIAAAVVVLIVLTYSTLTSAGLNNNLPQARYAWTVLAAVSVLFTVGIIKAVGREFEGLAFVVLALGLFLFDIRALFTTIIPRYFSELSVGTAVWRDPFATPDSNLMWSLRNNLGFLDPDIGRILSWRPFVITSGPFFTVLFLLYVAIFLIFLVQAVKSGNRQSEVK